jgi:hypothetical protein
MLTVRNQIVSLYVDRASQQWVVRDADGVLWSVPSGDDSWDHRQPFALTDETVLEPIPGHYKYLLGLF